jgi:uncharacterized repeat protein (TIGR03803 family)
MSAASQTEKVIYNFSGTSSDPLGRMVFDSKGNLYGTANSGAVFELAPQADGSWTETTIANLGSKQFNYSIGGLIFDSQRNLYGTSVYGGSKQLGTAFELVPRSGGGWNFKTLHAFGRGTDGRLPNSALVSDSSGNLYGVTLYGGAHKLGSVFKLTAQPVGAWKEKVLHSFGAGSDGQSPYSSLTLDAAGNLYGTADAGGTHGAGVAYELTPETDGTWKEKILYNFGNASDGGTPYSNLIFDGSGNLYGTTSGGGAYGYGTAFELTPNTGGGWSETILHNFGNGTDGIEPVTGLVFDGSGNLWGTTFVGGADICSGDSYGGNVFELAPSATGWTETVVANFCSDTGPGGAEGIVFDASGILYGIAYAGGTDGGGAAFEITP